MFNVDKSQIGPVIATLVWLIFSVSSRAAERPNIVFIFSDDHATNAISAYGGLFTELAPPNCRRRYAL